MKIKISITFQICFFVKNVKEISLIDQSTVMNVVDVFENLTTIGIKQIKHFIYKLTLNKISEFSCWIGGCVGELNHRKFWAFLLF